MIDPDMIEAAVCILVLIAAVLDFIQLFFNSRGCGVLAATSPPKPYLSVDKNMLHCSVRFKLFNSNILTWRMPSQCHKVRYRLPLGG